MIVIGKQVKVIQTEIAGEVIDRRFSNGGQGDPEFLVRWIGADGQQNERWLSEGTKVGDIQVVTEEKQ